MLISWQGREGVPSFRPVVSVFHFFPFGAKFLFLSHVLYHHCDVTVQLGEDDANSVHLRQIGHLGVGLTSQETRPKSHTFVLVGNERPAAAILLFFVGSFSLCFFHSMSLRFETILHRCHDVTQPAQPADEIRRDGICVGADIGGLDGSSKAQGQ